MFPEERHMMYYIYIKWVNIIWFYLEMLSDVFYYLKEKDESETHEQVNKNWYVNSCLVLCLWID